MEDSPDLCLNDCSCYYIKEESAKPDIKIYLKGRCNK